MHARAQVRRVVVTPTRVVALPSELDMSNRVSREFPEAMIRVSFSDEARWSSPSLSPGPSPEPGPSPSPSPNPNPNPNSSPHLNRNPNPHPSP